MTWLAFLCAVCDSLVERVKRGEFARSLLKRTLALGRLGRRPGRGFCEDEAAASGPG